MKVLHVIPSIAPVRGGPSQAVLQMVYALRMQGVDAEIATTNDNGPAMLDVPLNECVAYPVDQGSVPVRFFSRFSPAIAPVREFAFSAGLTHWLWQHLTDYDLLHVHAIFSYPSTVAMTLARSQGVPYVVRPLGQLCQWSLQQGQRKKQLYLNWIERANLQGSAALHFTSVQEREEAKLLGLTQPNFIAPHGLTLPNLIPNAAHELRKALSIPHDEPIITFLSRLHPKKGLHPLILALASVKHLPFRFVIAGNGAPEYEAEISQLLNECGLGERTHCLGFVSGQQKDLLLQGSDLFALTSHSENFGIAVLEALASELSVLVTPGVALSSTVQQHHLGWVVEQDPQAIAIAVQQALQNCEMLSATGVRARQIVQQDFSWNQVATTLIDQYVSVRNLEPAHLENLAADMNFS